MTPEGGLDRLTAPNFENGLGGWKEQDGGFQRIYRDVAGLELTRRLIEDKPFWYIPEMNRRLVEGTTHPERLAALIEEKGEAWRTYDGKPFPELDLEERIMTRLGEEGVCSRLTLLLWDLLTRR